MNRLSPQDDNKPPLLPSLSLMRMMVVVVCVVVSVTISGWGSYFIIITAEGVTCSASNPAHCPHGTAAFVSKNSGSCRCAYELLSSQNDTIYAVTWESTSFTWAGADAACKDLIPDSHLGISRSLTQRNELKAVAFPEDCYIAGEAISSSEFEVTNGRLTGFPYNAAGYNRIGGVPEFNGSPTFTAGDTLFRQGDGYVDIVSPPLKCAYCVVFTCNSIDDCSDHAAAVYGIWPACTCMCRPAYFGAKCESYQDRVDIFTELTPALMTPADARTACESVPNRFLVGVGRDVAQWNFLKEHMTQTRFYTLAITDIEVEGEWKVLGGPFNNTMVVNASTPNHTIISPFGFNFNTGEGESVGEFCTTYSSIIKAVADVNCATTRDLGVVCVQYGCTVTEYPSARNGSVIGASGMWPDCVWECAQGYAGPHCDVTATPTLPITNTHTAIKTASHTTTLYSTQSVSLPPTRTLTALETLSDEATLSDNPTPTIICATPPTPHTYFGVGSKYRQYINSVHPILGPAVSGLPCGFSSACSGQYGVRYISTNPQDRYFTFVLDTRVTISSGGIVIRHAVTKGASQAMITDMGPCTGFLPFTCNSGQFDNPTTNVNVSCQTLLGCGKIPTIKTPTPAENIAYIATTNNAPLSASSSCPTSSSSSSSGDTVLLGGVLTTSLPIYDGPLYGYAVSTTTALQDDADVITAFKTSAASGTPPQWRGSASEAFYSSPGGSIASIVVGDASLPSTSRPVTIREGFLGVVYPTSPQHARGMTPLNITSTTAGSVVCSLGDVRGYKSELISPDDPFDPSVYGAAVNCYVYNSVTELHYACSKLESCVGYSTVRVDSPTSLEQPMCLHVTGTLQNTPLLYAQMYYRKPLTTSSSTSTCTTTIEKSGEVAVYITQSAFETGTVIVRVNGAVTVCGGTRGFRHGFVGMDGRCDVMALCVVVKVGGGSIVQVSPVDRLASSNGCKWPFRAMISQTTIDAVQYTQPAAIPIARLNITNYHARGVSAVSSVAQVDDMSTYPLFVYRASEAALDVLQSGFDCSVYQEAISSSSTCPEYSLSLTTPTTCQSCGANAGFYMNNRSGFSDRCDAEMYCGASMPLVFSGDGGSSSTSCNSWQTAVSSISTTSSTTEYTGVIRVKSYHSLQASRTDMCGYFTGTLQVRRGDAIIDAALIARDYTPIFPLLVNNSSSSSSTAFRILSTAPMSLSSEEALIHAADGASTTTEHVHFLHSLNTLGLRLYHVDVDSSIPRQNSTLVCMIDHAAGKAASCTFPVPVGTTQVKVQASQTDFAVDDNTISVTINSPDLPSTSSRSVQCGGSWGFNGQSGLQEKCDVFSTCLHQNIFATSGQAATPSTTITISIPPHIRAFSCDYTLAAIITFTSQNSHFSCDKLTCPFEDKCIAESAFCDSIRDCNTGADEIKCGSWYPINNGEEFCVPAGDSTSFSGVSSAQCRSKAAAMGSSAFTIRSSEQRCIIYSPSITNAIFAAPSTTICSNTSSLTYVQLLGEVTDYTRCTASIHCGGQGVIGNVNPKDGDVCECLCSAGFKGTTCSEQLKLETIELIVVALKMAPSEAINSIILSQLAAALQLGQRRIAVKCTTVLPSSQSATTVLVECAVQSIAGLAPEARSHMIVLLKEASLIQINSALTIAQHPLVIFVTTTGSMTPLLTLTNCTDGGTTCITTSDAVRIRVQVRNSTSATSITLDILDGYRLDNSTSPSPTSTTPTLSSSNSRVAAPIRRQQTCTPASQQGSGGCIISTCEFAVSVNSGTTVRIADVVFEDRKPLSGTCSDPSYQIDEGSEIGNVQTYTTDEVVTEQGDFRWLLNGAIITFAGGFVTLLFTGLCCCCIHRRRRSIYEEHYVNQSYTAATQFKISLLARYDYYKTNASSVKFRLLGGGAGVIALAVAVGVAGAFLVVFYITANFRDSSFGVMYEEYPDSLCDMSPSSSMPRRIFEVSPKDTGCTKQEVTGETAGAVYAFGYCEGSDGAYNAILKVGSSFTSCADTYPRTITSGACMPLSVLDSDATRTAYVRITCSLGEIIVNRTKTLEVLTRSPDVFVPTIVSSPRTGLLPPTISSFTSSSDPTTSIEYFTRPFAEGSSIKASTSTKPNVYTSTATASNFDGGYSADRLILQDLRRTFVGPKSSDAVTAFSFEESQYLSKMDDLPLDKMVSLLPRTGDYPVGNVFGYFGTSAETTWIAAASTAQRYYGIQGSPLDVGAHLPIEEEIIDGDGLSISMYIRATETTRGFAFAVTDAFENTRTNQVYPLDRLAEMIENGQPSSVWLNASYNVYSSLFVDGPGRTLTFASVDVSRPLGEERVELLEWSLDRIGTLWLLNGLWHHVAIVFEREGGNSKAQLILDGETSKSEEGWRACVTHMPPAIQTLPDSAPVFDILDDEVTHGGLLVVGYFNGGVYGLTSSTKPLDSASYLATGSNAMREHNAFPRISTLALGSSMIVIAGICLLVCIITGYWAMWGNTLANDAAESEARMTKYLTIMTRAVESAEEFPSIVAIRYATALRWTSLRTTEFSQLLVEIEKRTGPDTIHLELLSILLRAKHNDPDVTFTAPLWNETVETDVKEQQELLEHGGGRGKCSCCGKTDEERDIQLGNGEDMFQVAMSTTTPGSATFDEADELQTPPQKTAMMIKNAHGGDATRAGTRGDANAGKAGLKKGRGVALGLLSDDGGSGGSGGGIWGVLGPVLTVFQTMGVWSTSLTMPEEFQSSIGTISSFFVVDFVTIFSGLETIIVPLAQLFLGVCIMCLLVYALMVDERRFEDNLCRYVWKRDNVDGLVLTKPPADLAHSLDDTRIADPAPPVHTLSLPQCIQVDDLKPEEETELTLISDDSSKPWTVRKTSPKTAVASSSGSMEEVEMPPLGRYCAVHPDTLLTPVSQDEITPYTNPRTCGVVVGGTNAPCGVSIGIMYVCCQTHQDEKDGLEHYCPHAVCNNHIRHSLAQQHTHTACVAYVRNFRNTAFMWHFTGFVLSVLAYFYTPIVKTALMILVCHPQYQCEFGLCYAYITQKFAIAIFLAAVIALFLGIGYPAILMFALWIRKQKLDSLFFAHDYEGRFETRTAGIMGGGRHVTLSEWKRYTSSNGSALQRHYGGSEYHWLFLPALFILFKVFVLIPIVVLEVASFEQRLGSCLVEIVICLFLYLTTSKISPVSLLALRVSSVHQLLQLGLLNMDLVARNDTNTSLGMVMIAVTVAYVTFSGFLVFMLLLWPVFSVRVGVIRVTRLMRRVNVKSGSFSPLWKHPCPPEIDEEEVGRAEAVTMHEQQTFCPEEDDPSALYNVICGFEEEDVENTTNNNDPAAGVGGSTSPRSLRSGGRQYVGENAIRRASQIELAYSPREREDDDEHNEDVVEEDIIVSPDSNNLSTSASLASSSPQPPRIHPRLTTTHHN